MYLLLSEQYGWTPQQIAQMTPAQVNMYVTGTGDTGNTLKFDTMADYNRYLAGRKRRGNR